MKTLKPIVLASGSVSRRGMLRAAGVAFTVQPANLDEAAIRDAWQKEGKTARETAVFLSEQKARKVSQEKPANYVIGSDQILYVGDDWLKKAESMDEAKMLLNFLRGRKVTLTSGVCVAQDGKVLFSHASSVRAHFRDFSDDFLDDYLAHCGESIIGVSGACCLEKEGVHLLAAIEGDYHCFLGMPLLPLLSFLREAGVVAS